MNFDWYTRKYHCVLSEAERYFLIMSLKEFIENHPDYMVEEDSSVVTSLLSNLEELPGDRR